jgi:hypothetical protein
MPNEQLFGQQRLIPLFEKQKTLPTWCRMSNIKHQRLIPPHEKKKKVK